MTDRPRKRDQIMYDTIQHQRIGILKAGSTIRVRLGEVVRTVQLLADPAPSQLLYEGARHAVVQVTGTDVTEHAPEAPKVCFMALPDQEVLVLPR